jgi:hypothetical protein
MRMNWPIHMLDRRKLFCLVWLFPVLATLAPAQTVKKVSFSKDVAPILSAKCIPFNGQALQDDSELDARIRSYELTYQMQSAAADAVQLAKEPEATKELHGIDEAATSVFGANCLMARKLVERGVRFVELYCGSGSGWDAHNNIEANLYMLGLDHMRLTYLHNGRAERPTVLAGEVIKGIFS